MIALTKLPFKGFLVSILLFMSTSMRAQQISVTSPEGALELKVSVTAGRAAYQVNCNHVRFLDNAPLGIKTSWGDFTQGLAVINNKSRRISENYTLRTAKTSQVHYEANELIITLKNQQGQKMNLIFRVGNHDIAFCYALPKQDGKASVQVLQELTGFSFPASTTTFLSPQSDAMIGWKRTKPSYEEPYQADAPMSAPSLYGKGYTFPCLFKIAEKGWVLISETGIDSRYCGSRLSEYQGNGLYQIAFPMEAENDGVGTVAPAFALPGQTPWRTITVGSTLQPIVETTVPWDFVRPLYDTRHSYKLGRGSWSWILWQDQSINYEDQVQYIDLAASMGYEYVLIDNWWDTKIGKKKMEALIQYAHSKNIDVFLWYSSSGYWNDIEQGPTNKMDNLIVRKKEMKWLQSQGVKGIKVDFFGGDKQATMRLYESILSDADDHGLMVIFHGATLPRGWERMYPNFVGSEAVLASENMVFTQAACDQEAYNACLHPFIRNAVASMEFGGVFLNKHLNKNNSGGSVRKTTDAFQLATAVLFQNPIQFFALAPNNLSDAPSISLDFMKQVPTTWDETRFIDGYPGRYVVVARRHGSTWYVAGINAQKQPVKIKADLGMFVSHQVVLTTDDASKAPVARPISLGQRGHFEISIQPGGGFILQGL